MRVILSLLIIVLLTGFTPRFCAGFAWGYAVGFQREIGHLPVAAPACPAQLYKGGESGYLIGLVQGTEDGQREWAFADHKRGR